MKFPCSKYLLLRTYLDTIQMTLTLRNNPFTMDPHLCQIIWKETFYTFWLFLFDASRTSNFEGTGDWTKITYSYYYASSSYAGSMDVGTGVFTAPLAGTYQFFIQVQNVSQFLFLTHNLILLLFTYTCVSQPISVDVIAPIYRLLDIIHIRHNKIND